MQDVEVRRCSASALQLRDDHDKAGAASTPTKNHLDSIMVNSSWVRKSREFELELEVEPDHVVQFHTLNRSEPFIPNDH